MPIDFPGDELRAVLESAKEVAQIALNLTALELYGNLGKESPVDHGRLQGSWEIDPVSDLEYRIFTNVEYALAVHDGSRPHQIFPKNAKALNVPGFGIFKSVWHPGYVGYPFSVNAIQYTELRLDEFVQMALQQTGTG